MAAENITYYGVLKAALDDISEHGFDSQERVDRWMRDLRIAAERTTISAESLEDMLRGSLAAIYRRLIDNGGVLRYVPGIDKYTIERVRPILRSELDRRIAASANLIKLNRNEAIEQTLRRFQGWSTSIPPGGVAPSGRRKAKKEIKRSLASLPFIERRVLIDQGHKLTAALSDVVATGGGAIAGLWRSNWRQAGYDYREDHKDRDGEVYLIRDSWAHKSGLVKPRRNGFTDYITSPGTEVFCFPGSSRVPWAYGVEVAYRRWYSGELSEIVTDSGSTISATPNHPILTVDGWVAAGSLKKGDHVVEVSREFIGVSKDDKNQAITTIAQIYRALQESGGLQSRERGSSEQFHGDGADTDVDIVATAGHLNFHSKSVSPKFCRKLFLSVTDHALSFASAIKNFTVANLRTLSRLMCGSCQKRSSLLALAGHSDEVCGTSSARGPASMFDVVADNLAGNVEGDRQGQDALASLVPHLKLGRVKRSRRINYTGHVFNLQTRNGWFVTEGIITHNCRCYYRYLFNLRDLPADMLSAKGRAALARARAGGVAGAAGTRTDAVTDTKLSRSVVWDAHELDRLGWINGVSEIKTSKDHSEWHAQYDDGTDSITLYPKFFELSPWEQLHTFVHEIGHRGQIVGQNVYDAFLKAHVHQLEDFMHIANKVHIEDFEREGIDRNVLADEVFAESYARACIGLAMPDDLIRFWSDQFSRVGIVSKAGVSYTDVWPNWVTRCQRCSMFLRISAALGDNACSAVGGRISAHGHCSLFEMIGARAA